MYNIAMPSIKKQRTPFSRWLDNKFLDWQKKMGGTQYLSDFADYIDFPAPTVSMWINSKREPKGYQVIRKLADKLGEDVFVVLSQANDIDPLLQFIAQHWDRLPDEVRHSIRDSVARFTHNGSDDEKSKELDL